MKSNLELSEKGVCAVSQQFAHFDFQALDIFLDLVRTNLTNNWGGYIHTLKSLTEPVRQVPFHSSFLGNTFVLGAGLTRICRHKTLVS